MKTNSPCVASVRFAQPRRIIIAALSVGGLLVSIAASAPAQAEGSYEYLPGGMFNFTRQRTTAATKKVTRRLRGRVRQTNAGGIPVASRSAKKSRKVRRKKVPQA